MAEPNKSHLKEYFVQKYIIEGCNYRDIAKDLGMPLSEINRFMKKFNIPPRKRGKRKKKINLSQ